MRVKVLFFGPLREAAGVAEQTVECAEGETLAGLLRRFPKVAPMRESIVLARRQEPVQSASRGHHPSLGTSGDRRGQCGHRGYIRASRGRVRGLPLCHRPSKEDRAYLEEGVLRGR